MILQQRLREYERKKNKLIEEFRAKTKGNKRISLGKSTSNLFRYRKKNRTKINVRNFNKVINVDKKNLIVEVEGMTTYEELVRETLKQGIMPTVVPELKSITIGGATTGLGIESSSFKFGLVHESITEMEILLGDGSIVVCTPKNKHQDLFFGFPNSYGTLGYALKLKVKVVHVKKYVKITHLKFTDAKEYFKKLQSLCRQKDLFDFIDGTIFNEHDLYITLGKFVDKAPFVSNYKYMNIYYKSIRRKRVDYLKISDYIWRWDTDWFWCSKHFGVQNPFLRFLVGKWVLKSTVYWKIRGWNKKYNLLEKFRKIFKTHKTESIVQDVEVPIENSEEFISFFHREIGIKPVWVCPTRLHDPKKVYPLYRMDPAKLYMNFGFWDFIKTKHRDGHYNQMIEKKIRQLKGKKSLYSTSFYSRKEFWGLYNQKEYNKLKKKYDPVQVFSDLYDKCVMRR